MTKLRPAQETICAAFVTYHPDFAFTKRAACLAKHMDGMIIVDNHSNEDTVGTLREFAAGCNIPLILNSTNLGVAAALNQAAKEARLRNYQWLLTLDQDCHFDADLVEAYLSCFRGLSEKAHTAIVAPSYKPSDNGDNVSHRCEYVDADMVLTSWSLLNLSLFQSIGGFKEELFLDEVDHDYCLRARLKGYRVLQFKHIRYTHNPGRLRLISYLGRDRIISVHSPRRLYYMTRNTLYLWKTYHRFYPQLTNERLLGLLNRIRILLLYEKRRLPRLWNIAKGVVSFCIGRYGK